jgi:hypothetical protein
MNQFTEEQLKELETVFGLTRTKNLIRVKDGLVTPDQKVWWRGANGPEECTPSDTAHAKNILKFPQLYSIGKPMMKVEYLD